MAAAITNIGKGRYVYYSTLPAANDALYWVLLVAAGLVADDTLIDYTALSTLLAGASDEATFTGYSRQLATGVVVTIDNTLNRVDVDAADPTWSPTTGQNLGKMVLVYEPDTTAAADANKIPLFVDDYVVTTPTTGTIVYTVAAAGFGRTS